MIIRTVFKIRKTVIFELNITFKSKTRKMPQELQVLRCCSCEAFQGHIVKKDQKWICKICNQRQSTKMVYGRGTGKDCRIIVQELNMRRLQSPAEIPKTKPLLEEFISNSEYLNSAENPRVSQWAEYVKSEELDHKEEESHLNTVVKQESSWTEFLKPPSHDSMKQLNVIGDNGKGGINSNFKGKRECAKDESHEGSLPKEISKQSSLFSYTTNMEVQNPQVGRWSKYVKSEEFSDKEEENNLSRGKEQQSSWSEFLKSPNRTNKQPNVMGDNGKGGINSNFKRKREFTEDKSHEKICKKSSLFPSSTNMEEEHVLVDFDNVLPVKKENYEDLAESKNKITNGSKMFGLEVKSNMKKSTQLFESHEEDEDELYNF